MADPREFTLIGSFTDHITPSLERINKQLATLKANFAGVGSRKNTGFRGATQEIGKLVSAHKKLSESVKEVQAEMRSSVGVLQQYRREMGKAAAATRAFQKAGGNLGGGQFKKDMDSANKSAQAYLRTLQQINSQSRRMPRGGMGGGFQPPRPPRGGGGGGGGGMRPPTPARRDGGGGGGMGAHMAEFGFAYSLGTGIAQPIQSAITQGFQIGVGLMTKPFEYFASHFGERVRDELSDLKAAGGFFSISQRQEGEKFIKTFDQAVDFTQENNKILAKLAAALPGSTQDYIEVSKRISDSVARTVVKDRGAAVKYAEELRQQDVNAYGREAITGMGPGAQQRAIQVMLGELTKKTVLAGQGSRAGAGGAMGAYGLPQLTERILSQQEVSMGQFQRYSAIFSDPMIMDALAREIPKINKTAASSVERFKAIQALYDSVLPPELIERYKRTVSGVAETFNTAIFGPETGLFGLGRKMEGLGEKFDEFGKVVVDAEGEVVKASLSLYDFVRDFIANIGQVFSPIVENITLFYDPLQKLGNLLADARRYTFKLLESFNYYVAGFKNLGFKDGNLRASLATIANLLRYVGAIGSGDFEKIVGQLKGKDVDFKVILSGLVDKLLNSKVAESIGETVGEVIGTVFSEVAKATGFISGRVASSNKLFDGLKKGFEGAGGTEAFKNIFKDVFMSLFKILGEIIKILPLEAYMLAGAMIVAPAAAQGFGMKIGELAFSFLGKIGGLFDKGMSSAFARVRTAMTQFFQSFGKDLSVKQVVVRDITQGPQPLLPPAKDTKALPTSALTTPGVVKGMGAFAKFMNFIRGVGPRFLGFFKSFGGALTVFGGVLTSIISLFSGKDLATSLAEGAGPVLGAALGAALIPFLGPIGPMIGAAIGGWIGSMGAVTEPLADALRATFGAVQSAFDLVIQIGRDVVGVFNGLIRLIPGVSQGFDLLRFAMFALLSPFKLLEIAINGIYDLYLTTKKMIPGLGLSPEEQARLDERRTQRATDEFTIQGREAAGYTLAQQKSEEYQKFLTAKIEGNTEKMNRSAEYMKSIVRMMGQRGIKPTPAAGTPVSGPTAAGTPVSGPTAAQLAETFNIGKPSAPVKTPAPTAAQLAETFKIGKPKPKAAAPSSLSQLLATAPKVKTPTAPAAPAKAVQTTAALTNQINQKATTQVKETTAVKASTEKTTQAVNNLTSKMTAQSSLQQTVANIYSLLASGATRVMATLSNLPPGFSGNGVLPPGVRPNLDPSKGSVQFPGIGSTPGLPGYRGNLGDAISTEMKNKPPGSKLVVANSSETIIPKSGIISAAGGYVPKINKMAGAIAQVYYGMGMPQKKKTPGGGAANWMKLIDEDYTKNVKDKPWPGGPTRNSGRGGLDMWEGPGSAYLSPNGMYQQGGSSAAAAPINVTSPITINTQPGQNADEIASLVAMKIGDAVAQARASSVFV